MLLSSEEEPELLLSTPPLPSSGEEAVLAGGVELRADLRFLLLVFLLPFLDPLPVPETGLVSSTFKRDNCFSVSKSQAL